MRLTKLISFKIFIFSLIIFLFSFCSHEKILLLPCEYFGWDCSVSCYYGYCDGGDCCTYPGGSGGFRCVSGCCQDIDDYGYPSSDLYCCGGYCGSCSGCSGGGGGGGGGCTPDCDGKVCGDDGCGGSCGTCTCTGANCRGSTCSGGQCIQYCGSCSDTYTRCYAYWHESNNPSCNKTSMISGTTSYDINCSCTYSGSCNCPDPYESTTVWGECGAPASCAPSTTTTTTTSSSTTTSSAGSTSSTASTTSLSTTSTTNPTRYSCNLATGDCYTSAGGSYTNINTCNSNCDAHFACNPSTGNCDASSGGSYTSRYSCDGDCDVATTTTTTTSSTTTTAPASTTTSSTTPETYTVTGQVFVDENKNGTKDTGESCYEGSVEVSVGGEAHQFNSTTSCNTYSYTVSGQCPVVNIVPPTNYESTGWYGTDDSSSEISGSGGSAYLTCD